MKQEENLQIAVCDYLRYQYPHVMFTCDLASGMKLTIGQAVKVKRMRSERAWPDLFIAEPRGLCAGLFIELKREGVKLKKCNGDYSSDHIWEQERVLSKLNCKGFETYFAVGFDEAKKIIDNYLNN